MPVRSPTATGQTTDPLYQDGYSQFCYELPFMPGQTGYFDTPVVPTSAFAGGYNHAGLRLSRRHTGRLPKWMATASVPGWRDCQAEFRLSTSPTEVAGTQVLQPSRSVQRLQEVQLPPEQL